MCVNFKELNFLETMIGAKFETFLLTLEQTFHAVGQHGKRLQSEFHIQLFFPGQEIVAQLSVANILISSREHVGPKYVDSIAHSFDQRSQRTLHPIAAFTKAYTRQSIESNDVKGQR